MNTYLKEIEIEGAKYGLKLNRSKCEAMHITQAANIHFANQDQVRRKDMVKYLRCHLNQQSNYQKELNHRISNCMAVLKRLDLFWRHSDCPISVKLVVLDATIRTKLLYGFDSAQLNEPQLKTLDTFHLKALRKILRMTTTFVNRQNTNHAVISKANETIKREGKNKKIKPFRQIYHDVKTKRLAKIHAFSVMKKTGPGMILGDFGVHYEIRFCMLFVTKVVFVGGLFFL